MAQGGHLGAGELAKKGQGTRHLYYHHDSTLISYQRGIYLLRSRESLVAGTRGGLSASDGLSTSDGDQSPNSKHRVSSAVAVLLRKTTP